MLTSPCPAVCGNHSTVDALISPSVLASNFADLGNEVKRMMDNGAQWVHMGQPPYLPLHTATRISEHVS